MTNRFALKELEAHCGTESGDWSVMSTAIAGGHKLYAVAHRRGGAVSAAPLHHPSSPSLSPRTLLVDFRFSFVVVLVVVLTRLARSLLVLSAASHVFIHTWNDQAR